MVFKEQMASEPKHVEVTWNFLGKGTTIHLSEGGIFITKAQRAKGCCSSIERFKNTQRNFLPKYQRHNKNLREVTRADDII